MNKVIKDIIYLRSTCSFGGTDELPKPRTLPGIFGVGPRLVLSPASGSISKPVVKKKDESYKLKKALKEEQEDLQRAKEVLELTKTMNLATEMRNLNIAIINECISTLQNNENSGLKKNWEFLGRYGATETDIKEGTEYARIYKDNFEKILERLKYLTLKQVNDLKIILDPNDFEKLTPEGTPRRF